VSHPSHSFQFIIQTILGIIVVLCSFLCSPVTSYLLLAQIFSSVPYSQTPSMYVRPSMWATKFHTHT
jgi:hypothetical protein